MKKLWYEAAPNSRAVFVGGRGHRSDGMRAFWYGTVPISRPEKSTYIFLFFSQKNRRQQQRRADHPKGADPGRAAARGEGAAREGACAAAHVGRCGRRAFRCRRAPAAAAAGGRAEQHQARGGGRRAARRGRGPGGDPTAAPSRPFQLCARPARSRHPRHHRGRNRLLC